MRIYSKQLILGGAFMIFLIMCITQMEPEILVYGRFDQESGIDQNLLPVFIIIVCNDPKKSRESSFDRQMNQVTVLLKSAASLTKTVLRFLVVTDSEEVFQLVQSIPSTWPESFRNRLVMERRAVWYPADREEMRNLLRPCSSARLFLPEIITDIDSAVLVDTDTLFLRPPEGLLQEIFNFNETHAAGLAQTSMGLKHRNIPYPGTRGVNTGVMVMNLTRLRALPGGWTGTTLNAFDKYNTRLACTATNDIINIALAMNPEILFDLNCVWNYGPGVCWLGNNNCDESEVIGASLLHGTSASFVNNRNPKFRAVYEGWLEHPIDQPISVLLTSIERRIRNTTSAPVRCNKLEKLPFILTQALKSSR